MVGPFDLVDVEFSALSAGPVRSHCHRTVATPLGDLVKVIVPFSAKELVSYAGDGESAVVLIAVDDVP